MTYRAIVELISSTTITSGLIIRAEDDLDYYVTDTKITNAELAAVPLAPHDSPYRVGPAGGTRSEGEISIA